MSLFPIEIKKHREAIISLPQSFTSASTQNVQFGRNIVRGVKCNQNEDSTITISSELQKRLKLPSCLSKIHLQQDSSNHLTLGTLVGIFTIGFTPSSILPIGNRSLWFQKLLSTDCKGVIPFIFGERDIDWGKSEVVGLFYTDRGWEKYTVPLPQVVYDRLPNRKSEKLSSSQKVKAILSNIYQIPWYNPGFFNKHQTFSVLANHLQATPYLPETHLYTRQILQNMLVQYGMVYVKPIEGSSGKGIHKIRKNAKHYVCEYSSQSGNIVNKTFQRIDSLHQFLTNKKRPDTILIQQGIQLLTFEGHPLDFRVHINKDEGGVWHVSAIAGKAAKITAITTHIRNGGRVLSLREIPFGDKIESILSSAALTIGKSLDERLDGHIGEIGFDFGLDEKLHPWLFEANSKPGRSIFFHPELRDEERRTRELSLAYSSYLAKEKVHQGVILS
ncbi:hypothetical protein Q73_03395 [Bacillus coahuilensis m2-6]|uniref:YheC/YheD family endospore coat-associated protein n=1 Tax=Bacillus coahuilensis TaxID=408580 RepID=UPI00075063B2|nr:YheC/YheD family protein [Bacillus coahuilensis]KUP09333.1 hypothetical protein Q73_03395 [Bacillus coahuilensis m2-6]